MADIILLDKAGLVSPDDLKDVERRVRTTLEPHETTATELVFIGRGIGEVQNPILAGLRDAEARDALPVFGRHRHGRCGL